jgi:hypothetical protein
MCIPAFFGSEGLVGRGVRWVLTDVVDGHFGCIVLGKI